MENWDEAVDLTRQGPGQPLGFSGTVEDNTRLLLNQSKITSYNTELIFDF